MYDDAGPQINASRFSALIKSVVSVCNVLHDKKIRINPLCLHFLYEIPLHCYYLQVKNIVFVSIFMTLCVVYEIEKGSDF